MLKVQEYLKSGKTLDDLKQELGIKSNRHPNLPFVILNYDQFSIEFKTHPIVSECRGLVLHSETFDLVARSFNRFFNWGEVPEKMNDFDFNDFVVQSKEDGSLVIIFNWQGQWYANTRNSFGLDLIQFQEVTWREGICQALKEDFDTLNPNLTYICEFCSPWNKIIRSYPEPILYLLTVFDGENELPFDEVQKLTFPHFTAPEIYQFNNVQEIKLFLEQNENNPTFEGVVIHDCHHNRWKIKNSSYLFLHKFYNNGNGFKPKYIIPFILSEEVDELLVYFEDARESVEQCRSKLNDAYQPLEQLWLETYQIPAQKDFALAIINKTPFAGLLFKLRKEFKNGMTLLDLWRQSSDLIYKTLYE